jgi:hypothetical protein
MEIKSFDSLEEMFDHLEHQNAENLKAVKDDLNQNPWKLLTVPGDYVMLHAPSATEDMITIGRIEEAFGEDAQTLADNYSVLVYAWSPLCPEGELGSTYAANIYGWVTEEFAQAFQEGCREHPGTKHAYYATLDMLRPGFIEHTRAMIMSRTHLSQ